MKHTIQALVENKFGVLARIASLFSARGYNIESLAVGETQDPSISCMTIIVNAEDEKILEQIKKQLHKLIDVITVVDFTKKEHIGRELVLVKIKVEKGKEGLWRRARVTLKECICEVKKSMVILELVGDTQYIRDCLGILKPFGIVELVRTGKIVIEK